eukprot:TRINITY_DN27969_c0_g1_i1.p1 TRINITY_DN27969_c0_g1~~TRINITY_DN27969_c0_g1_i1.p1  ORF type:complete len:110 (+),score=16.24 TRINITY_DN27969_c0_g1_i1:118-447(+)
MGHPQQMEAQQMVPPSMNQLSLPQWFDNSQDVYTQLATMSCAYPPAIQRMDMQQVVPTRPAPVAQLPEVNPQPQQGSPKTPNSLPNILPPTNKVGLTSHCAYQLSLIHI